MTRVALIGNVVLDICVEAGLADVAPGIQSSAPISFQSGGGLPNVGNALLHLGVEVVPIGAVGDDQAGRLVAGMLPWPMVPVANARTEVSVIGTVGERTILNQQGTASLQGDVVARLLPQDTLVLFAYLNCSSVSQAELPRVVELARERGFLVVGALNGVFSKERHATVRGVLPALDLIVMNEHEARWLTDAEDLQGTLDVLTTRVGAAIVTLGSRGFVHLDQQRQTFYPIGPVRSARTLGAGDAFLAGTVAALASGKDQAAACDLGRRSASAWVANMRLCDAAEQDPPTGIRFDRVEQLRGLSP